MSGKKIAILGNMNNAGFVLMRHLRDLGEDAHLLLYKNDGEGHSSHFNLKSDSWDVDKWEKFVHSLPVSNGYGTALSSNFFLKTILWIAYLFRRVIGSTNAILTRPASNSDLKDFKDILSYYDSYIGSGNTPAIFESLGLSLDIFYPYSDGIENFNELAYLHYLKSSNPMIRLVASRNRDLQKRGISSAKACLNTEITRTKEAFDQINVQTHYFYPPHLYDNYEPKNSDYSETLNNALSLLRTKNFKIISHARHYWIKDLTDDAFHNRTKNNDWLIKAFSNFLSEYPDSKSLLVLVEYGKDFLESKILCDELNISDNVLWLPTMQRKEILRLISECDIGAGEFQNGGIMIGSCGYEIISKKKPLLQGPLEEEKFYQITGIPRAPGFYLDNSKKIEETIITLYEDRELRESIGNKAYDWYEDYSGSENARRIVKLISDK